MTKEKRKPGPKVGPGGKKIQVQLSLSRQTRDMLHQLAADEGIPVSGWVSRAVLLAVMKKQ
jgi:hypothetical protein